ncbi:MAG: hypothetical protein JSS56_10235 [Proteobacteria bacterium]|nr:hypothetical protein [Pseudomonadota bacterium]
MNAIKRKLPLRAMAAALALGGLLAGCGGGGGDVGVGVGVVVPAQEPAVAGLTMTLSRVGPEAVQVDWSDDPDVASFVVVRDGSVLATVSSTTSLVDTSVIFNDTYCYRVDGYDAFGHLIAGSSTGCLTIVP